jgi:SAM-dependent methyltransferase
VRPEALQRLAELPAAARVLDVGGWAAPVARADAVIDLLPYETRGLYGPARPEEERFDAGSWAQADICGPDPWPFDDGAFDVVLCSHTLEDVRDPVFVARELSRVARSGYVEVPAPVEELTHGVQGDWVGWSHHRWISEREETPDGPGLVLTHKPHLLSEPGRHLPTGALDGVPAPQRVLAWWWEGALPVREQVHVAAETFDAWLDGVLRDAAAVAGVPVPQRRPPGDPGRVRRIARRLAGR